MTRVRPRLPAFLRRARLGVLAALLGTAWLSLLGGCASGPSYVPSAGSAQPGEVQVTGRLNVVYDGKPVEWGLFHPALIIIAPANGHEGMINELKRTDGRFFWSLAPGKYIIVGVIYQRPTGATRPSQTLRVAADFTVPTDAQSAYIGTLKIVHSAQGSYNVGVQDHYEQDVAAYREQFPGKPAPAKAMMHREAKLGSYTRAQHICAPDWGLTCTSKHHGITPLSPRVEADGFPLVQSLRPEFKWQASSRAGVSYDLVIYQAVAFHPGGITTRYLPGSVVDYQQGLTAPDYRPATSLQPDNKYFWTVRLRRDGIVSNWSSMSYFQFMVFAAKSGVTPWFGFSTPPAK